MSKKLTVEEFSALALLLHDSRYNYNNVVYKNNATKIEIICPAHGSFWQTPRDHLSGYGCNLCGRDAVGNSKRRYSVNKGTFLNEDDISYYLLGAYYTDGNIEKHKYLERDYTISSKDRDWVEDIRDLLSPHRPIYLRKQSECFTLKTSDKDTCQWLIANGCIPNKSLSLSYPEIPTEYLPDFIRGCIEERFFPKSRKLAASF